MFSKVIAPAFLILTSSTGFDGFDTALKGGASLCSGHREDETILMQTSMQLGAPGRQRRSHQNEPKGEPGLLAHALDGLDDAIKTAYQHCKKAKWMTRDKHGWQGQLVDDRFLADVLEGSKALRLEALQIDNGEKDKESLHKIRASSRQLHSKMAILKADTSEEARRPFLILDQFKQFVKRVHRGVHVLSPNWHFFVGNTMAIAQLMAEASSREFKLPADHINLDGEWRALQIFSSENDKGATMLADIDGVDLESRTIYVDARALDKSGNPLDGKELKLLLEQQLEEKIKNKISAIFHGDGNVVRPLTKGVHHMHPSHHDPQFAEVPDIDKLRTCHHFVIRIDAPELDMRHGALIGLGNGVPTKACEEVAKLAKKLTHAYHEEGGLVFEYTCGLPSARAAGPPLTRHTF